MERPRSSLNWFEIPVKDLERGVKFYNTILEFEMPLVDVMGNMMAFFPVDQGGIGGALIKSDEMKPSKEGSRVYLNGGEDLEIVLSRVERAGGKITVPKTKISDENGYYATFIDTEGNMVSLHSMK